ncbi:MAG: Re/Si-specific NAD(P)(+) transhydrogenase subunit alpha, partial [Candidatus Altiarchaeales archaeon]|nr:Re/Si-specific NAD(P)(+) transhydrogenase subunit alpha [Candidatus Altiarchaeales archaeon]
MRIGIPSETRQGETRVAITPAVVGDLLKSGFEVYIEKDAGLPASFSDEQYSKAGARVVKDAKTLYNSVDLIVKIHPPTLEELNLMPEGITLIGLFWVLTDKELVKQFAARKMTVFSLELVPRITRAQSMDVLSSMSTVAGYKAVLISTEHFGKFFPLLMTAAGTVLPANVFVIGAGVAGLQAIATAKRLGAKVEAFDTRQAVKEQVESLGAKFVEMELPGDAETKGGYAKEMSEEFIKKEMEAIGGRLPKTDIVITTAQVFGKKAPLLITEDMVKLMPNGSVIVDIAAEQGGNCALTKAGEVVRKHNVSIVGPVNL